MIFSVWAPLAKSVSLVLADARVALERAAVGPAGDGAAGDGCWTADVDASRAAEGYRYSVDEGPPLPDPRSRWQPDGVHGSSRLVDATELQRIHQSSFRPKVLQDAVMYELHVGTFTPEGTYAAAQGKLQHLVDLGITHVELLPLATFPGAHGWGYDGVDLYAPLPAYGTPQDLARFVRACHDRGLAVLLDVVYNHLGPDGNYLGSYGPYFTDRVKTPWGEAINYDGPHSDGVRRFVIDNALMWLRDYGFDGLRLDAVHAIFSFEAVHVLEELAAAVKELGGRLGRQFVLIAESDLNDPRLVHSPARGGYGLDAHWEDDFHHAVHRFFTGENNGYYSDFHGIEDLALALRDGYVYQGRYSAHRLRRHGRPPRGISSDQLVVCAQNHDQIGNRAQGERLSMLLEPPQLKAIAALTLLAPFVPMLFQGEEWGACTPFLYFTDHQDEQLGKLVAEGRTKEFSAFAWAGDVPNPQAPDTFSRSKLDWTEVAAPEHAELLEWYRRLIALRSDRPERYRNVKAKVKFNAKSNWLTLVSGAYLVVLNFGAAIRVPMPAGDWEWILGSDAQDQPGAPVPARATRIFRSR
jgi:maltooligosyltrehalose trehalohydrolase